MAPSLSSFLNDIIETTNSVEEVLRATSLRENNLEHNCIPPTINLPTFDRGAFMSQLNRRNVSAEVCTRLSDLLQSAHHRLLQRSSRELEALLQRLSWREGSTERATFEICITGYLAHACQGLQEDLLLKVDRSIALFHADAEASAQRECESSSSSSDEGVSASRGLPPLAVRMFEAIYDRTDKITQAERDRLSAATGVPARSVTIWVSLDSSLEGRESQQIQGRQREIFLTR